MSIALILTVAAAIFVIATMDARTRRLAFRIEHLHQMRSDDTSARLALNEKVNQLVDELRAYIVSHFDEGSEFYALRMQVADLAKVNIVPQDEPMSPEENGAPENWTEQRITKLEQAVQTKASALQPIEQKDKLQALRIDILGGADESGLPIPGALSELRQQVEGINSHLGKKIENATKLNKAAIQLVAQSAARTEVRTILRKRKGFWAVTWGNFWRWLISPVK